MFGGGWLGCVRAGDGGGLLGKTAVTMLAL